MAKAKKKPETEEAGLSIIGGTAAGAAAGSILGPIGAAAGAVIGGVVGARSAQPGTEVAEAAEAVGDRVRKTARAVGRKITKRSPARKASKPTARAKAPSRKRAKSKA